MKISDVKNALKQYELNVSVVRAWMKESHIQELEKFYLKINGADGEVVKDRELKDEEYLEVVAIIRGKNTWSEHPSSIVLGALANKLGGQEALNYFDEERLNVINLKLLEEHTAQEERRDASKLPRKNEDHGLMLAKLLQALTPIVPSIAEVVDPKNFLAEIIAQANNKVLPELPFITKLVEAKVSEKAAYLLIFKSKNLKLITDLLILLNKHGLCKDKDGNLAVLDKLDSSDAELLNLLKEILSLFDTDAELMMQENLTKLFKHSDRCA